MKNVLKRRFSAILLAFVLAFASSISVFAADTQPRQGIEQLAAQPDAAITRAQFAMLVNSVLSLQGTDGGIEFNDVPGNHPYASDLRTAGEFGYLVGDGNGNLRPDATISGSEASIIIAKLLDLDTKNPPQSDELTVPEWARPSASILLDLGLIKPAIANKGQLTVSDAFTLMNALAVAVMFDGSPYTYSQSSVKDDFYAYTNRKYLATAVLPPGSVMASAFNDTYQTVLYQEAAILSSIISSPSLERDSDKWKINELYNMYLDNETRTASISKLKPIFDEIRAVKSIDELKTLSVKYTKYFDLQPFYSLVVNSDARVDAKKWCVLLFPGGFDLGSKDYYVDDSSLEPLHEAYRTYLESLLRYIGEGSKLSDRASALFNAEQLRASAEIAPEEYQDPDTMYKKQKWSNMLSMTKSSGIFEYDTALLEIVKDFNIYCPNTEYIKVVESLYTEENLQLLKDYALLAVFSSTVSMLGDDIMTLSDDLQRILYGQIGEKLSLEQRAHNFAVGMMPMAFSNIYKENYCTEEVKNDVTEIVETIRDKFEERINSLSWMSEQTKKAAVEKLNAIETYVAYPDEQLQAFGYTVKSQSEGGNLVDLYFSIAEEQYASSLEMLRHPVEYSLWDQVSVSTVNAFYSPTENAIIIPAGILQGNFYNPEASREENLGGIGAVIAHELTHAFDNSGARYDKDGTLTNWWTAEDYKAFTAFAQNVANELSQISFVGDMTVNGPLCTGETIADLGAIACVLDIADDMPDADLGELYTAWAELWASRMSPEIAAYLLSVDSHAPNKVRVNFVLSQQESFFTTYGISEEDGMYVPEDRRVNIW